MNSELNDETGLTPDKQLACWAAGESICPNTAGECCPDFSCCQPNLAWPIEKRKTFIQATQGQKEKMLMGSLAALFADADVKAYITRGNPDDHQ